MASAIVAWRARFRWMRNAVTCFDGVLADVTLQRPGLRLTSNAIGHVSQPSGARAALARQIAETVR